MRRAHRGPEPGYRAGTGVLRTEAASRGGAGALGVCLAERYGAAGPGIVNYPEFGLGHLGWTAVEAWRRQWFTAGNAVLCIVGAIPDGLRLGLPAGPPPPAREPRPMRRDLPGYVIAGRGGIGVSLAGPRSVPSRAAVAILRRRLTQVLRYEHGLTYDVQAAQEEVAGDLIHTWLAADALPERLPMAAHAMFTAFETLAGKGCDQEEIDDYARRLAEAAESPAGPVTDLQRRARAILDGRPESDPRKTLRMARELTPDEVASAAGELYDQAIVATPHRLPAVEGRMRRLPEWSGQIITGNARKSADSGATLTTGDDGVMLTIAPGQQVTVRYDAVAALLRWNDGKQTLVGEDGFAVQLDPDEWADAVKIREAVAARVSPGAVVDIDAPGSPRPGRGGDRGQRPQDGAPAAGTGTDGAAARWRRTKRAVMFIRVLYTLMVIGGMVLVVRSDSAVGIPLVVVITALRLKRRRARRGRDHDYT